nr:hypothetical protein [Jiangella anatolica]
MQPQLVDQTGEVLVDGRRTARDRDIAVAGRRTGLCQCRLDSVGDEVVRGAALHRLRFARVVGKHEDRRLVRRIVAPPAVPVPVPLTTHRAEHVAPHDEGAGGRHLLDLGLVLGPVGEPGVQLVAPAVAAEGTFLGLVEPGRLPVGRHRDVADDLARARRHRSGLLRE